MGNLVEARDLSAMMIEQGVEFASSSRIGEWIGCDPDDVAVRLRGARQAREMVCVTKGGWVPARNGRTSTPSAFVDPLMRHLGHAYYLGFLSAAGSYSATHQACFGTDVATSGPQKRRIINRVHRFDTFHKRSIERCPTRQLAAAGWGLKLHPVTVSTPEATLLDLIERPHRRGSHIYLNVVCSMIDSRTDPSQTINADTLAETAMLYSVPVRQRLGFVIEQMAEYLRCEFNLDPLHDTLPRRSLRFVHLEDDPDMIDPPLRRDERWKVYQWWHLYPDVKN